MPRNRPFQQVDVSTATRHRRSALAVVLAGEGLSTEATQRFADPANHFRPSLAPEHPNADCKGRIFCPGCELPLARGPAFRRPGRSAEDLVTGSPDAGLAWLLIGEGLAPPRCLADQRTALGRAGRVQVERDAAVPQTMWIRGECVGCIAASVRP